MDGPLGETGTMTARRLLVLTLLLVLATACSTEDRRDAAPATDGASAIGDPAMGHIHGIGVDPADGTLYAATHFGVFEVGEGTATRIADRWQDTMAFTVVGPRHFLASGHPDLREDLPPHLGLIESTDAGETWQPLALQGEADFHALEPAGDTLYAFDALSGALLESTDRRTFRTIASLAVADLAAPPAEPGRVLATTARGLVSVDAATGAVTPIADAPELAYVDWPRPGLLVGLAPDGLVHVSTDRGATWKEAGRVPGHAAALEIAEDAWFAATEEGLYRSTDGGTTWVRLVAADPVDG